MDETEKISNQKAIAVRSEEVDDILGKEPNILIKWGISLISIVILLILTGSYFFRYPDVVLASITITTDRLPVNLISKTSGKISVLLTRDKQLVREKSVLAIIKNTANFNDIQELNMKLDSLFFQMNWNKAQVHRQIENVHFNNTYILGEIQESYLNFLKALREYNYFISSAFQLLKIASIRNQIAQQYSLQDKIVIQSQLIANQLELSYSQFMRDSLLYESKTIPRSEFEKSKTALLQFKVTSENATSNIDNSKITILQLEQQIMDLQQQWDTEVELRFDQLTNSYKVVINKIITWEETYLLITPITGSVTFTKFWCENQDLKAGECVMTIIPVNAGKFSGKMQMPLAGSGKVKVGQRVDIKLLGYPYLEYGTLTGIVENISMVPIDDNYFVEIKLPNGLRTNYGKVIPNSYQLQGKAEIITDNIRLIERFLQPIYNLIHSGKDR